MGGGICGAGLQRAADALLNGVRKRVGDSCCCRPTPWRVMQADSLDWLIRACRKY